MHPRTTGVLARRAPCAGHPWLSTHQPRPGSHRRAPQLFLSVPARSGLHVFRRDADHSARGLAIHAYAFLESLKAGFHRQTRRSRGLRSRRSPPAKPWLTSTGLSPTCPIGLSLSPHPTPKTIMTLDTGTVSREITSFSTRDFDTRLLWVHNHGGWAHSDDGWMQFQPKGGFVLARVYTITTCLLQQPHLASTAQTPRRRMHRIATASHLTISTIKHPSSPMGRACSILPAMTDTAPPCALLSDGDDSEPLTALTTSARSAMRADCFA